MEIFSDRNPDTGGMVYQIRNCHLSLRDLGAMRDFQTAGVWRGADWDKWAHSPVPRESIPDKGTGYVAAGASEVCPQWRYFPDAPWRHRKSR